ncbi:MAG: hypothetical protein RLZ16_571, partial [Bacteroidota bacterium]
MSLFGGSRFNNLKSVAKKMQEQTFNPETGEYESGNKHFDETT